MAGGWNEMGFKVPSNPSHSGILGFSGCSCCVALLLRSLRSQCSEGLMFPDREKKPVQETWLKAVASPSRNENSIVSCMQLNTWTYDFLLRVRCCWVLFPKLRAP